MNNTSEQVSSSGFLGSSNVSDGTNESNVEKDDLLLNDNHLKTNRMPNLPIITFNKKISNKKEDTIPLDNMVEAYKSIISHLGEDINRQGLLKTPQRAAKAMLYFTKGYEENFDGN